MALKSKYPWRGIIRGNLRVGKRVAAALIRYHEKHDPASEFLTDSDVSTVVAFQSLCSEKLNEKRPV